MMKLPERFVRRLRRLAVALLTPAEDPRKTHVRAFDRHLGLLGKVQRALEAIGESRGGLEANAAQMGASLSQLGEEAQRALLAGRENAARLLLLRRYNAKVHLDMLNQQLREIQQEEQRLTLIAHQLRTQIESFSLRQEVIAARYTAAATQVQVNEAFGGLSLDLSDLGPSLKKAEDNLEEMQARVWAIDELVKKGVLDGSWPVLSVEAGQPSGLPEATRAVEDELAALKHGLRLSNPPLDGTSNTDTT